MADLYPLYLALRGVMIKAPGTQIAKDALGEFTLNVASDIMNAKDPVWFGSVRLTGTTVSYFLPPLASRQGRDLVVADALKRHSTSKTCFVFSDQTPELLAALETLTQDAARIYSGLGRAA